MTEFLDCCILSFVKRASPTSSVYRIQVLDRAIAILDVLAEAREGRSLADISAAVGVHKSTTHRIIMNLEGRRIIDRDPATGRYHLGLRLFELGSAAIAQFNIRDRARPYLERVVNETEETVHLCVMDAGEVLYVDKVEPSRSVRMTSRIGLRNPAHCTAVGKVMMAWLSDAEMEAIVARHGLRRFTANTITTLAGLRVELAKIRELGYALDDGEHEDGVRCVASVVRDHAGRPAAALSVSAPSFRMPRDKVPAFAKVICKVTQELSREWGYNPAAREAVTVG